MKYTIIGGGPSGIFTALLLATKDSNNDITILEKWDTLGGAHRVDRDGYGKNFSEHGPRIYMTNYFKFEKLLELCNVNFRDHMIDYKYDFVVGLRGLLKSANILEIYQISINYLIFIIYPGYFEGLSVDDVFPNFSKNAKDYINKICTLTDGATSMTYSASAFFSIFNQNAFYKIVEPNVPNDIWLWHPVIEKLKSLGVKILYNKDIKTIEQDDSGYIIKTKNDEYKSDSLIITTPPLHSAKLFKESDTLKYSFFNSIAEIDNYAVENSYIPYISFTLHFEEKIDVPDVWGNGFGEWGVAWIVMSDYFEGNMGNKTNTLISALIVNLDTKSSFTNKTANQTIDKKELMSEAYRQINLLLKIQETPTLILNKRVEYKNNQWITDDTPFMKTKKTTYIDSFPINSNFKNLYWVGPHNGNNIYQFTSMENVCENVLSFYLKLYPEDKDIYISNGIFTLNTMLMSLILVIIIAYHIIKTYTQV
tara:strand:- start:1140 stop:2576 length:1437 start_codon:yes stop_codon:yes gene_type:complete